METQRGKRSVTLSRREARPVRDRPTHGAGGARTRSAAKTVPARDLARRHTGPRERRGWVRKWYLSWRAGPEGIRTPDLAVKSRLLYRAKLRALGRARAGFLP